MNLALWIMLASGIVAIIFFILLQAESAQNKRLVLSRLRSNLDTKIVFMQKRSNEWSGYFGTGSLRILLHYLAHQVLSVVLKIIKFSEKSLGKLRHRNKMVAKAVKDRDRNHLDHIAEHKESTALSDKEKQDLKAKSLEE